MCAFTGTILPHMLYILARHQDFIKTATLRLFISFHGSSLIYFNYFDPSTCGWLFFGGEKWQDSPSFNLQIRGKNWETNSVFIWVPLFDCFQNRCQLLKAVIEQPHKECRTQMATILKGLCSKQLSFLIHNLDGKGRGWKKSNTSKIWLDNLDNWYTEKWRYSTQKKNMPHPTSINPSRNQTSGSSERVFSKMAFRGLKIWMTRMCCENGWYSEIIGYSWNWIGKKTWCGVQL